MCEEVSELVEYGGCSVLHKRPSCSMVEFYMLVESAFNIPQRVWAASKRIHMHVPFWRCIRAIHTTISVVALIDKSMGPFTQTLATVPLLHAALDNVTFLS